MKEISEKPKPKSMGHKIKFQIEYMLLMLNANRMDSASIHLDKALALCDEAHLMEYPDDKL